MALSTYWVSQNRKDLAERAIVARREREATRAKKCNEVASYHKDLARKSTKYRNLEEAQTLKTPRVFEESSVRENLKAAEKEKIELRRQRLAHVLAVENDQYMKELKELTERERDKDPWNIRKLKEQIEELQRKRKETEQNAQKKYMHMSTSYGNISREKENEHLQKEVTEAWKQRKEDLEKLNLEKQQREKERIKALELEHLKAAREAREVEILQLQEQEKWSNSIQNKMDELNAAESDTRKLKAEKEILIGHLENLLSFQRRREAIRDMHRKAFQKIQSLWQAKEKLRRMLNEVKHGLEFDSKLLLTLADLNNSASEDTALALLDLSCIAEGKEKIEMQLALERQRELEMQQLYHEEAASVCEKRKEEWILEAIARDEIMNELFKSLASQIKQKIEFNMEEAKKLINVKENYLRQIDDENQKTKDSFKTLVGKHDYYTDRANRLNEELDSISSIKRPASVSSSHREHFTGRS